jgi:hypothetical protein
VRKAPPTAKANPKRPRIKTHEHPAHTTNNTQGGGWNPAQLRAFALLIPLNKDTLENKGPKTNLWRALLANGLVVVLHITAHP